VSEELSGPDAASDRLTGESRPDFSIPRDGSDDLLEERIDRMLCRLPSRGTLRTAIETLVLAIRAGRSDLLACSASRPGLVGLVLEETSSNRAGDEWPSSTSLVGTTLFRLHGLLRLIVPQAAAGGFRMVELGGDDTETAALFGGLGEVRTSSSRYGLYYGAATADRLHAFPPPSSITRDVLAAEEHRMVSGSTDERTFAGRVQLLIEGGPCDQKSVAQALGMSVATLRRRLAEEDGSFRQIRARALTNLASAKLRTGEQIGQIASELGFADVRSFSRAFKGWTGLTPSEQQRQGRSQT
jgi:AraC-like DNA-binding protein